jgi:hypothetical protein
MESEKFMFQRTFCALFLIAILPLWSLAVEPVKTIDVPAAIERAGFVVRVQGSTLIQNRFFVHSSAESSVRLVDLDTRAMREINVWPTEPTESLVIKRVIPLRDGRIAVGLREIRWDSVRAEVLAIFDKSGSRVASFQTNPIGWDDFALDSDQTVWMFGICSAHPISLCEADYPTLRHYSLKGELIDGFLPYKTFPDKALHGSSEKVGRSHVFVSPSLIGVYVGAMDEWIQLDRKGAVLSREAVTFPENHYGQRLAMSPSGKLVCMASSMDSAREWVSKDHGFSKSLDWTGNEILGAGDGRIALASNAPGVPIRVRFYDFQ